MSDVQEGEVLLSHLRGLLEKRLHRLAQARHRDDAPDPVDALHDLRVASRRLRAFGDVLRGLMKEKVHSRTNEALKRVIRAAGKLRDRDVQRGLVQDRREKAGTDLERATLEHLLVDLETNRAADTRRARKTLEKTDYEALASSLRTAFEGAILALPDRAPVQRLLAEELLTGLVDRAEEVSPPLDGAEDPDALHRLRIAVKKLRYALELFEPTLGTRFESLGRKASALQELLGNHHDLVVLGRLMEERASDLDANGRSALASGMRALGEGLARERAELVERFRAAPFDPDFWRREIRHGTGATHAATGGAG